MEKAAWRLWRWRPFSDFKVARRRPAGTQLVDQTLDFRVNLGEENL